MNEEKTKGVLKLKQRYADRLVYDIKVSSTPINFHLSEKRA